MTPRSNSARSSAPRSTGASPWTRRTWYTPSAYYTGGTKNDYAAFFHTVSLNNRAYAFPYDDINDQSSVQILNNANPPTALTLGIGW